MADIKGSHEKKGYLTIAANQHAGIAMRKNINEPDRRLMNQVWFDTGLKMADGKTPRTVAASSENEVAEYRKKGFKEVGLQQDVPAPISVSSESLSASGEVVPEGAKAEAPQDAQAEGDGNASAEAVAAGAAAVEADKGLFDAGAPGDNAQQGGKKSTGKKNP